MIAFAVVAAAVLALRRLLRGSRRTAPAAPSAPSPLLPVLACAAGIGAVSWWLATHPAPKVITAPAPRPVPTVTVTAPPHATSLHVSLPFHLSGTDWTVIAVVALFLAYAAVRPLLHRSTP